MKTAALDVGDVWTGSAVSDALKITCSPYKTFKTEDLEDLIAELRDTISVSQIVIGHPKTMKGTESEQTKKVIAIKKELEDKFPEIEWILWDERLSSKRAEQLPGKKILKKDKIHSHSQAAAFILQSYLDSIAFNKS